MPRLDGEVLRCGTAIGWLSSDWLACSGWRAYRRMIVARLGAMLGTPDASVEATKFDGAALIKTRKPAYQDTRRFGAAQHGIRQDRRQFGRLIGAQILRRFAERPACAGFSTEFAIGAPFRDVEVDFQDAPLRQNQGHPDRERNLQDLADEAAALPKEQVLCGLLGNGGGAAGLVEIIVGLFQGRADFAEVDAGIAAEAAVL